jgi:hypothetical protein
MEGRAVVQANPLAEIGETNAIAVSRNFLENGKGAPDRLDAPAAGAILHVFVDIGEAALNDPWDRGIGSS